MQMVPEGIAWRLDRFEFRELIAKPREGAPGPDGIPYIAYRTLSDTASPILLALFTALAGGELPPPGFIDGCLFLLPKTDSTAALLPLIHARWLLITVITV